MIDVLYIKGKPTDHDDMEMRLSLRSLENGKNIDRVFVVGNKPDFVKNVIHIPAEDTYQFAQNHFEKVFKAIDNGVSDNFLLMNDDFFMMKQFDAEKYPYFHRGALTDNNDEPLYRKVLSNTYRYLMKGQLPVLNYAVHCPIRYNKHNFCILRNLAESVKKEKVGYSARILYGNMFVNGGIKVEDCKMYDDKIIKVGPTKCLSSADNCEHVLEIIEKKFPNKSRWEV